MKKVKKLGGKKNKGKTGDTILSFAVGAQQILLCVQILLGELTLNPERIANYRVGASAVVVLLSLFWIIKRKFDAFLVMYLIMGVLFIWSVLLSPQLSKYIINEGFKFTSLTCLPILLAFLSIRDYNIFHKTFLFVCILTSFVGIIYSFLLLGGYLVQDIYNIAFGYSLMMPVLYFMYTRRPVLIALAVVTTICIIIDGSRGPAIVIAIYALFLSYKQLSPKKILFLCACTVLLFFVFSNIDIILSFLSSHNIRSRTLLKLLDNDLFASASREDISELGIAGIWKSPILGYGVFGDRLFYEPYIHNIVLEIFLDFGIPMGLVLMFLVLYRIIGRFIKTKGSERDFLVLLVFGSIIPLMASSSYLVDFRFFFLLAILISPVKKKFCSKYSI